MPRPRELDAGDLVWIDLEPIRGREQAGRRPAVVVTPAAYHKVSQLALICPITSNLRPWPFKVFLPDSGKIRGAVLVDQVRAVDRALRIFARAGRVPDETLGSIRNILAAMIRPEG